MKDFEIFVCASYITDGGSKHCNCFKVYVLAPSAEAAKANAQVRLEDEGYDDIEMAEPIEC